MKNDWRQKLHLEPFKGWLNDPNGLSFFNGMYHVYFQYCPDSAEGRGNKYWGHFQSPDLLKWEFTGAVLVPDKAEDKSGVYSGCGLVKDDVLCLFYTGNVKHPGNYDYITDGREANQILVTTKDGHSMSDKVVLLRNEDYPECCTCHVRDPKVWEEDGKLKMVLGARKTDDTGCALIYAADKPEGPWVFEKEIYTPDFGYMWECPDIFTVNGKKYLGISPQGLEHTEFEHQNVYSSGYFDEDMKVFTEWDYGFDFYAPQTFETPDGRRLLIGWMGIVDIPYTNPTAEKGWQHCLTIPRELAQDEYGRLVQRPFAELNSLRREKMGFSSGDVLKTDLPFELSALVEHDFEIRFGFLEMRYKNGIFTLEFTNDNVGCGRTKRSVKLPQCMDIRIIADTSSMEVYLNGGQRVMSTRFYPASTDVDVRASGISGLIYTLGGMEVKARE
ncbi:MAG: glycoside hydrolase family 32 protein [Firmicutes bacterium]|nr:glycoside hydrolase family 32 protein [Bacillota bacterium]